AVFNDLAQDVDAFVSAEFPVDNQSIELCLFDFRSQIGRGFGPYDLRVRLGFQRFQQFICALAAECRQNAALLPLTDSLNTLEQGLELISADRFLQDAERSTMQTDRGKI